MLQGLQRVLSDLGGMMAAPDADVQFITTLQHAIAAKITQNTQQSVAGQQAATQATAGGQPPANAIAPGGGAGMSGFGGLQPQAGQAPAPGMGAPGPGGLGSGNPDEMRRVLAATGQAQ